MKKITFATPAFLLIISMIIFSFSSDKKQHDSKLVGIWKGFEKDKETDGVEKHWIQERFENGTYVIMFSAKEDCEIETLVENGEWWTENGKFYEKYKGGDHVDVYEYKVENPEVVSFKSIEMSGEKRDDYIFSDYKLYLE